MSQREDRQRRDESALPMVVQVSSVADAIQTEPWLSVPDMCGRELFNCSRTTLYEWLQTDPNFPRPFRHHGRLHWLPSKVSAYRARIESAEIAFGQLAEFQRRVELRSKGKSR
jgi:hypothetical protein